MVLPKRILDALRGYQFKAIEYGVRHHGRVLLGDEIGLGKTLEALSLTYLYKRDWPLLILSPTSMKGVWRDEVIKWLQIPKERIEVISNSKNAFKEPRDVYILPYDLVIHVITELENKNFKVAIADEIHFLQNVDAKRTKLLIPILMQCKRVITLSGAPTDNPVELFATLHILRPDIWPSFKEFGFRYCDARPGFGVIDWTGRANLDELHFIMKANIMIRRNKKEVESELPEIVRQKIEIEPENKLAKKELQGLGDQEINKILMKLSEKELTAEGEAEYEPSKRDKVLSAHKMIGTSKLKGLNEFLILLMENAVKTVVFAYHEEVLTGIEDIFKKKKRQTILFKRDTSEFDAKVLANRFNKEPETKFAIVDLAFYKEGIRLSAATAVVFVELIWKYEVMARAETMVERVNVYYVTINNPLENLVYAIVENKGKSPIEEGVYVTLNENEEKELLDLIEGSGKKSKKKRKQSSPLCKEKVGEWVGKEIPKKVEDEKVSDVDEFNDSKAEGQAKSRNITAKKSKKKKYRKEKSANTPQMITALDLHKSNHVAKGEKNLKQSSIEIFAKAQPKKESKNKQRTPHTKSRKKRGTKGQKHATASSSEESVIDFKESEEEGVGIKCVDDLVNALMDSNQSNKDSISESAEKKPKKRANKKKRKTAESSDSEYEEKPRPKSKKKRVK